MTDETTRVAPPVAHTWSKPVPTIEQQIRKIQRITHMLRMHAWRRRIVVICGRVTRGGVQ